MDQSGGLRMEIGVLYLSHAMLVLAELIVCSTRGFACILAKWFWQRVMVGQQILCTGVGPAWRHCLIVIDCLFLHSDWMMCLLPILL